MLSNILGSFNRLQSLDFLRGCAITIVFVTHFGVWDLQAIGVDLFFVLSGHLVSLSLWSALNKTESRKSYLVFFLKRLFRIIPAYYFFLIFGYFLALLLFKDISPQDIPLPKEFPQYFLFYRNYGGPPSRWSMEHLWSLSVEEQFYWILPAIIFFLAFRYSSLEKRFLYAAAILLFLGIGLKAQAMITDFAEWPTYTHNRLDAFGWGIYLTLIRKEVIWKNHKVFDQRWLLWVGITALTLCLTVFSPLPELVLRTLSPICWVLVILGLYYTYSRFFVPFRIMSYFSYGIYLWHFLFVIPVHHYFGTGLLGFLVYALATLSFAIFSTLVIERYSLQVRDKFLGKLFPGDHSKFKMALKGPQI
ncbi:acyltransferase family protein [Rufibacter aurantiacus]|uniref:acyltransferase family protein n=1 Tax=Rufibacter aurantiacus TaxID=2817374 RepID=UPI001B30099B|nr:acyltransferase [Rufibacter aurantiacus]